MALRKEARLMSEYEQTHTVRSHTDREAEFQMACRTDTAGRHARRQ